MVKIKLSLKIQERTCISEIIYNQAKNVRHMDIRAWIIYMTTKQNATLGKNMLLALSPKAACSSNVKEVQVSQNHFFLSCLTSKIKEWQLLSTSHNCISLSQISHNLCVSNSQLEPII